MINSQVSEVTIEKDSTIHDLGFDSLDAVEFIMKCEVEFSISIPDDDAEGLVQVDQIIDYLWKTQTPLQDELRHVEKALLKMNGQMSEFKQYKRSNIAEMRPYVEGEVLKGVSISDADLKAGSPLVGDMIARNPKNHEDKWLVAKDYFNDNFEEVE